MFTIMNIKRMGTYLHHCTEKYSTGLIKGHTSGKTELIIQLILSYKGWEDIFVE